MTFSTLHRRAALLLSLGLPLLLGACGPEPLADGVPEEVRCASCHGTEQSPAPPAALDGASGTWHVGVGAHQLHLQGGTVSKGIACSECHAVPRSADDSAHADGLPAELVWGALAAADGAQPQWDRASETCNSTYCHGATLTGGERTAPKWTFSGEPDLHGVRTCSSCHGAPPPAPHPEGGNCASCHGGTVKADGTLDLEGGKHLNGTVDVVGAAGCNVCHGGPASAAPDVGAHRVHLEGGQIRGAMACEDCHLVPASVDQAGHRDGEAALTWGALAGSEGATPAFADGSCSGVYCHGATLPGGSLTTPQWAKLDGTQAACGTCHATPPASPHPEGGACVSCHPTTVLPDGRIDRAGGHHVDGTLDVGTGCTDCHGGQGNAAPPFDTLRNEATTARGVGAHQAHLRDGALRQAVACGECHPVPDSRDAAGHLDGDGRAEVVFGVLSKARGAQPAWDGTSCSSTYCHGATLSGGSHTAPEWTRAGGTEAVCGTCHGAPPPAPHSQERDCSTCHGGTVKADGSIDVAGGKHMNGAVE